MPTGAFEPVIPAHQRGGHRARPSPRPVSPRPSVVVALTSTGQPSAADKAASASARRDPSSRGGGDQLDRDVADPPAGLGPAPRGRARGRRGRSRPSSVGRRCRAGRRCRRVRRRRGRRRSSACATTSPSECPAQPSTSGHSSPASRQGRPASIGCTSVPIPTRGRSAVTARLRLGERQVVRHGHLRGSFVARHGRDADARRADHSGVVGEVGTRPEVGVGPGEDPRWKPCGVCTRRRPARPGAGDQSLGVDHHGGVDDREHRDDGEGTGGEGVEHPARRPRAG